MVKKKIIAGALALSMVLGGTGYAYWTDQLNITTKATTGNLDVTFADLGCLAQYTNESKGWSIIDGIMKDNTNGSLAATTFVDNTNYDVAFDSDKAPGDNWNGYAARRNGYNNVTYVGQLVNPEAIKVSLPDKSYETNDTKGSDKIEITLKDIYPGYAQAFRTDILNNGNIAATLSNILIDTVGKSNANVENSIGIALYIEGESQLPGPTSVFTLANKFDDKYTFRVGNVDFVRLSALSDPTAYNNINRELLCIPSNNRMDAILGVAMDPATTGTDSDAAEVSTMKGNVTFTIDLDWTQFNEGKGINADANILSKQN